MKLEDIIYSDSLLNDYKIKTSNFVNVLIFYKETFNLNDWQYAYLDYLIKNFDKILTCKLSELLIHKNEFLRIKDLKKENCNCKDFNCPKCTNNESVKSLSETLQSKLDYSNENLRDIISKKGLKVCYICNAQYAMLVTEEETQGQDGVIQEREIAKFQIDHYLPKSLYPAFSISLSNLYPICGYCNLIKSNNEYDLSDVSARLKFSIDVESLRKYLSGNKDHLKLILFDESEEDQKLSKVFDLKGIYNNHLDEIEELIERKIKYEDTYKNILVRRFPEITLSNKNIENRLILGTYSKEEGFYKRPLSKFIHDINDQLDSL